MDQNSDHLFENAMELFEVQRPGFRSGQCVQYPETLDQHRVRRARQCQPHGVRRVAGSHRDTAFSSRGRERFGSPRASWPARAISTTVEPD
jgi:hypothetical protein